jgi:tetratricopeptide (TPR) repeat protein
MTAGTAVSTWQAIRATKAEGLAETRLGEVTNERNRTDLARQEADRRATEAKEVVDFLINDLIGAASPSRAQGKIPTVDQVLARADQIIAKKFVDRPLIEAAIRHALAGAYEELGRYPKAQQHAARAVELRLAHLGPEHSDTISAQNALGWAFDRQGQNERARNLLTPVLATARKVLGPGHQETLGTMHNLAAALDGLGRYDEARALDEELLAVRRRVLGPEHLTTLATMNNLANCWRAIGNLEKAKHLYEQVVDAGLRDRPNHPNTFIQMSNLAGIYRDLGQLDRAVDMNRRVMQGRLHVLGLAHPFTGMSIQSYFDSAWKDRASWQTAQKTLEQILDRSARELGPEAKLSIALTGWLANLCSLSGQTERAINLVDALPEKREALNVREVLARYLCLDSHGDAALVQFQRVEALRPRLVPTDDPSGLWIRNRLAHVLREHGRLAEARPLLEQSLAEALRLRKKLPNRQAIEEARALAQLLLGRWPGLAPGLSPAQRPTASFAIDAAFSAKTPVADGRIAPGEYGSGIEVTFDGDANPGRMYLWYKSRSKTPDDLSARLHTAYTDRSLFLAFLIRDQFLDAGELDARVPSSNDAVEVFINGDLVANDLIPWLLPFDRPGNREGFQLIADAGGHQFTSTAAFTNADWKVGTSRTSDGYIVEFEVPLALIDTRDGPEYVPATTGSELLVNFGFVDIDGALTGQVGGKVDAEYSDYGIFWAEDPAFSPLLGGEDFWTVSLRLVPKPATALNARTSNHPDERHPASAGTDGTVKIWEQPAPSKLPGDRSVIVDRRKP